MNPYEPPEEPPLKRSELDRAVKAMNRAVRFAMVMAAVPMVGVFVLPFENPLVRWGLVAVGFLGAVVVVASYLRVVLLSRRRR